MKEGAGKRERDFSTEFTEEPQRARRGLRTGDGV
jgi:hypothetical protein